MIRPISMPAFAAHRPEQIDVGARAVRARNSTSGSLYLDKRTKSSYGRCVMEFVQPAFVPPTGRRLQWEPAFGNRSRQTAVALRPGRTPRARNPPPQAAMPSAPAPKTEDTFAIDAGRDLFFAGMDDETAIGILDTDFGGLPEKDDRFIAAERLQFFPSEKATTALLSFVNRFDLTALDSYVLEDRVARRKCVETLGRYKGQFQQKEVVDFLLARLRDPDELMIEVAVWALGEIGVSERTDVLFAVADVLDQEKVEKRVVIQTLMRAGYDDALERIEKLADSSDLATASAALTAVSVLTSNSEGMKSVQGLLRNENLGVRRAALEDILLSQYVPSLDAVAVAPNSIVLRARTCRGLLERLHDDEVAMTDETAALLDRLVWDHPCDLDLLGMRKDTKKARDLSRNVRQLYKNDAIHAYLATRTLGEDHADATDGVAGEAVLSSFKEKPYFDYFGAYHVFKTLGWLQCEAAVDLLLENAENLPPRFFNHQVGAITALAAMREPRLQRICEKVAAETSIWELKYACLLSAERLGLDNGALRLALKDDSDWLVRARARHDHGFDHLRDEFS